MSRKQFVLDTSVFIHDPKCIYSFKNSEVCIPIFVIIELDDLKISKRSNVAFAAREASRTLISIQDFGSLNDPDGIHLEDEDIIVRVIGTTGGIGIQSLQESNNPRKMDLWILQAAMSFKENSEEDIILVSKDMNMRLLAEAEGLEAEDYESDKVPVEKVYLGFRDIGECERSKELYIPDVEIPADDFVSDPVPNEFYLSFYGGTKSFLSRNIDGVVTPVPKEFDPIKVIPKNLEQRMALDILSDPNISLITLVGKAGTGKTFLALAAAIAQLERKYERIILSKPTVDMGRPIGFLPGNLDEKLQPWMQSYFDNLDQLIPTSRENSPFYGTSSPNKSHKNWSYLIDTDLLQIQPINSIRGRSISNAFMIIDEAQNLTPHEVKTLITRAAEGTKVILSGDPFQVDDPYMDKNSNGLTYVTQKMKGSSIFATVFFTEGVRSKLSEEAATLL